MATKPVHKISVRGVRASIWENQTKRGPMLAATFDRLYKVGDEWRSSGSFSAGELDSLAEAVNQARAWILKASSESEGQPENVPAEAHVASEADQAGEPA